MNRKYRNRGQVRAFTIIEVIVIVVILGVLAAVIAPRLISHIGSSKVAVAHSNAESLATAMKIFCADRGGVPDAGTPITVLWTRPTDMDESAWHGPYVDSEEALKDPWGNLFVLVIPGQVNADFDIMSYGKDGQPGGDGENTDIFSGKK